MSSWQPRRTDPRSVVCFPVLKFAANSSWLESQATQFHSIPYRLCSAVAQLLAASQEERSRPKTLSISACSPTFAP